MERADKIKKLLAEHGRKIARGHLVMGAMGNISARVGRIVWIKRAGSWLARARLQDFIAVDMRRGRISPGELPSKELFLHLGCYRARAGIGAVVHTHPVMSTALASAGVGLLCDSPGLRQASGSKIAILRYYSPGSRELADRVRRAIKKANVVLLADHGLVTVGRDIKEAYLRTIACENEAGRILATLRRK